MLRGEMTPSGYKEGEEAVVKVPIAAMGPALKRYKPTTVKSRSIFRVIVSAILIRLSCRNTSDGCRFR